MLSLLAGSGVPRKTIHDLACLNREYYYHILTYLKDSDPRRLQYKEWTGGPKVGSHENYLLNAAIRHGLMKAVFCTEGGFSLFPSIQVYLSKGFNSVLPDSVIEFLSSTPIVVLSQRTSSYSNLFDTKGIESDPKKEEYQLGIHWELLTHENQDSVRGKVIFDASANNIKFLPLLTPATRYFMLKDTLKEIEFARHRQSEKEIKRTSAELYEKILKIKGDCAVLLDYQNAALAHFNNNNFAREAELRAKALEMGNQATAVDYNKVATAGGLDSH